MCPSLHNTEIVDQFEDASSTASFGSYKTARESDTQLSSSFITPEENIRQTTKHDLASTSNPVSGNKRSESEPSLPVFANTTTSTNHDDDMRRTSCSPESSNTVIHYSPSDMERQQLRSLRSLMDNCRIGSRTQHKLIDLLLSRKHDAIYRSLARREQQLETLQCGLIRVTKDYAAKHLVSRYRIRKDLIKDEYRQNKTLNKFELATDEKVQSKVDSRLNKAWLKHMTSLAELEDEIRDYRIEMDDVKAGLYVLRYAKSIALTNESQMRSMSPEPPVYPSFDCYGRDITVSPIDEFIMHTSQMGHINTNTNAISQSPVVVSLPRPSKDVITQSTQLIDQATGSQPSHKLDIRGSKVAFSDRSSVFVSKKPYVHNDKEDTKPVVCVPATELKRPAKPNPFAGLDNYARELYSKSPVPEPSDADDTVLVNLDVMKKALDERWSQVQNREINW